MMQLSMATLNELKALLIEVGDEKNYFAARTFKKLFFPPAPGNHIFVVMISWFYICNVIYLNEESNQNTNHVW